MTGRETTKINELITIVNTQQEMLHQLFKYLAQLEAARVLRRSAIPRPMYQGQQLLPLLDHAPQIHE